MAVLLGIDIGTSGTKTALFDERGQKLGSAVAEYPLAVPRNGWAEQDPEDWWRAVGETCRAVLAQTGINPRNIAGVGLSGQMHGLVMLDGNGKVLRPAIIWCDQRTAEECAEITERIGARRLLEITANPALTGFTAGKIRWVQKHEPEIYTRCRHILLPKDFVRYRLTGEFAGEMSDGSGMQLMDIGRRAWSDEVLTRLDIDRALLPRLYESPEVSGQVSAAGAAATGLAPGTPVVGGAGDNAAAAVGTGVVREGIGFTTIGTSGVVYAHTNQMHLDPGGRVHTFCCAVPGAWHVMGVVLAAGHSLRWLKSEVCADLARQAEADGVDPYRRMDELAASAPIGANRLLYLPYLSGERTPHLDPDIRGAFVGLAALHQTRDLIRAVLEGVSFSLLDCLTILREMGLPMDDMRATGGGASPFWMQMLADVFACPVSSLVSREGPALGAAILAGAGTGVYASVAEGCDVAVRKDRVALPDPAAHRQYMPYYDLFRSLYDRLAPVCHDLAHL